jgi:prepilin-type N-terminal cleavage/methylation domain-containing protein
MRKRLRTVHVRAFTLVELLVATAIFGVLVSALCSLLFGALRLRETTFAAVEAGLPRAQVAAIIQRDLTNLVVPAGVLAGPFMGEPVEENNVRRDKLSFYTTTGIVTDKEPWGDIQEIQYYLQVPEDRDPAQGLDLMRQVTRNLLASVIEESQDTTPWRLARGVNALQASYWDGEQWQDTWNSTTVDNANPKAVELRVEFVNGAHAEHVERPIDLVCEIAPQPRSTPTASAATSTGGSTGGSANAGGSSTPRPQGGR